MSWVRTGLRDNRPAWGSIQIIQYHTYFGTFNKIWLVYDVFDYNIGWFLPKVELSIVQKWKENLFIFLFENKVRIRKERREESMSAGISAAFRGFTNTIIIIY